MDLLIPADIERHKSNSQIDVSYHEDNEYCKTNKQITIKIWKKNVIRACLLCKKYKPVFEKCVCEMCFNGSIPRKCEKCKEKKVTGNKIICQRCWDIEFASIKKKKEEERRKQNQEALKHFNRTPEEKQAQNKFEKDRILLAIEREEMELEKNQLKMEKQKIHEEKLREIEIQKIHEEKLREIEIQKKKKKSWYSKFW